MTASRQDIANLKTQLGSVNRHWEDLKKETAEKLAQKGSDGGTYGELLTGRMMLVLTRAADVLRLRGLGQDPSNHRGMLEEQIAGVSKLYENPPNGFDVMAQEALKYCYIAQTIATSERPISYEKAEAMAEQKMGWKLSRADAGDIGVAKPSLIIEEADVMKLEMQHLHQRALKALKAVGGDATVAKTLDLAFSALDKVVRERVEEITPAKRSAAASGRPELEKAYQKLDKIKLLAQGDKKDAIQDCWDCLEAAEKVAKDSAPNNIISAQAALKSVCGNHLKL